MKIGIFLCWREHLARDYFYTLLCVHERDVRASGGSYYEIVAREKTKYNPYSKLLITLWYFT